MRKFIVIPALNPNGTLLELASDLLKSGVKDILVVDDGSAEDYKLTFEKLSGMGCIVISHATNLGKGRALKTGFNYILNNFSDVDGVVTCDADGQHLPKDIMKALEMLERYPGRLILGDRTFIGNGAKIPVTSLLGNVITNIVFFLLINLKFKDTQCGLRGYPINFLSKLMNVSGEHFEYESQMLFLLRKEKIPYLEYKIETVYDVCKNKSHFNKLLDSYKIYRTLLSFAAVPIFGAVLAIVLFQILKAVNFEIKTIPFGISLFCGWTFISLFFTKGKRLTGFALGLILNSVLIGLCSFLTINFELVNTGIWYLLSFIFFVMNYLLWLNISCGKRPDRKIVI